MIISQLFPPLLFFCCCCLWLVEVEVCPLFDVILWVLFLPLSFSLSLCLGQWFFQAIRSHDMSRPSQLTSSQSRHLVMLIDAWHYYLSCFRVSNMVLIRDVQHFLTIACILRCIPAVKGHISETYRKIDIQNAQINFTFFV